MAELKIPKNNPKKSQYLAKFGFGGMDSQMQLSNAFQLGYALFPTISQFPTDRISFPDTSNISFDMDMEMTPDTAPGGANSSSKAALKRLVDKGSSSSSELLLLLVPEELDTQSELLSLSELLSVSLSLDQSASASSCANPNASNRMCATRVRSPALAAVARREGVTSLRFPRSKGKVYDGW